MPGPFAWGSHSSGLLGLVLLTESGGPIEPRPCPVPFVEKPRSSHRPLPENLCIPRRAPPPANPATNGVASTNQLGEMKRKNRFCLRNFRHVPGRPPKDNLIRNLFFHLLNGFRRSIKCSGDPVPGRSGFITHTSVYSRPRSADRHAGCHGNCSFWPSCSSI